ncbi:MAG: hypothetical protein QOI63_494, partial [Thermoplasmata archaeon]|nr:hypothetical protein [Thermoplasmata archaeon]
MPNVTREERRLQKEQAKAAKAEAKAQRKAGKDRKGEPADEAGEPEPMPEPAMHRPRLELVTEPGPVKHLHWDAERRARLAAQAAPPPAPSPAPEPAAQALPNLGRRRTLYTTENGNQVVAYGQGPRRQLAITEGGQEVAFD